MNICDKNGDVGIPHIWTDVNWRKGLDCSHQLLYTEKTAQIQKEYRGMENISDPEIIRAKGLRVAALIGRFKGCHWLYKRAQRNPTPDNYDPEVMVFVGPETRLPHYIGADEKWAVYHEETFYGFLQGFDREPIKEGRGMVKKRFSETLLALKDYQGPFPPFLSYCGLEANACVRELQELASPDRRVQRLIRAMESITSRAA